MQTNCEWERWKNKLKITKKKSNSKWYLFTLPDKHPFSKQTFLPNILSYTRTPDPELIKKISLFRTPYDTEIIDNSATSSLIPGSVRTAPWNWRSWILVLLRSQNYICQLGFPSPSLPSILGHHFQSLLEKSGIGRQNATGKHLHWKKKRS